MGEKYGIDLLRPPSPPSSCEKKGKLFIIHQGGKVFVFVVEIVNYLEIEIIEYLFSGIETFPMAPQSPHNANFYFVSE